ncbi:hypothetical protein GH714_018309 [Hevea brasiliensis]|uniref:Major facilitator superfamily (MFS) profile domain-containing protein n=1 Tax=Hevea brasiliensis TaxID=3981 RepID=A0A6A6KSI7_HEVBR|nr:hypothetical protein GH714_018309 [Hevea brasiliensis]
METDPTKESKLPSSEPLPPPPPLVPPPPASSKLRKIVMVASIAAGMLVQPIVGYHSDRCTSRFGRRRPFIAGGALAVAVAVFLIGYAADLGQLSGDPVAKSPKPRAIAVFVVGFWILDVANNMLQGPCRALLADLSGANQKKTRIANALYSFFMAVGNVLGFAAGSYTHFIKYFHSQRRKLVTFTVQI